MSEEDKKTPDAASSNPPEGAGGTPPPPKMSFGEGRWTDGLIGSSVVTTAKVAVVAGAGYLLYKGGRAAWKALKGNPAEALAELL